MKIIKGKAGILLGAFFLLLLLTSFCPEQFQIVRRTLAVSSLWKEHENLKIVFLSDLHLRENTIDSEFYSRFIQTVNQQEPDLILISGDILDRSLKNRMTQIREPFVRFFSRLKSKYGIFAVTGNHEVYCGRTKTAALFRDAGIRLLDNEIVHLRINGKDLPVMGISEQLWSRYDLPKNLTRILRYYPVPLILVHRPDAWLRLNDSISTLVLSGHTHGGLVRIPFLNGGVYDVIRVESHQQIYKELLYGYYRNNQKQLLVTSGVDGSAYYFRINCPPEIVVIQLRKDTKINNPDAEHMGVRQSVNNLERPKYYGAGR